MGEHATKAMLVLLCLYCFCLQFTPSEPYLVPILTQVKHFSNNEVTTNIFPVSVYCTLVSTLLAIPACTYLNYRTVILIGTFGLLATFITLLLGKSLVLMQLMQATYSLAQASALVFSSYLFVLVNEDMFQSLTSYTQATATFSNLIAAELSQLLILQGFNLMTLLYVSIFMVALASIVSCFLPKDNVRQRHDCDIEASSRQEYIELLKSTWRHPTLKLLSVWWALQVAGTSMVENYGTNLFDAVDRRSIYNGHVIAATQGASCLAALAAVPLSRYAWNAGGLLYVMGSALTWLLCLFMVHSKQVWTVYLAYITCVAANKFLLCILYVQCAQLLSHGHYIFLFSLNAFGAQLVQCALQAFVGVFDADIFAQFTRFGSFFLLVCITSSVMFLARFLRSGKWKLVPPKEPLLCTVH